MKTITDKQEFYKLSRRLELGNVFIQWTADEFESKLRSGDSSDIPAIVGVRHAGRAFAGGSSFRCTKLEALQYLKANNSDRDRILFDEAAFDPWITLQGELMNTTQGIYLRYSHAQKHQRDLWRDELSLYNRDLKPEVRHSTGVYSQILLREFMDEDSRDKVNEIIRDYEDPIIEFTCFDRRIGRLRWNTIFWEVRCGW